VDDLLAYFQSLLEYAQNNAANLNPASQKALGELILLFSQTIEEQSNKMAEQGDIKAIEREQAQVSEQVAQPPSGTPPTGGNIPPLQPAPHESSNINAFRYNPENQQLFVKFQGKYPQQNGPVYRYEGVPDFIFNVFSRGAVGPKTSGSNGWHTWKKGVTPSHGAAMAALIKNGGYQYQRMS
jgi:hypothetical protein